MGTESGCNNMDKSLSLEDWLEELDEDLDVEQCSLDGDCEACGS